MSLSASSSDASLSKTDLVVVVTADGSRPRVEWDDTAVVTYVDARRKTHWPALAELDVPLHQLPRAYLLADTDDAWLRRPRPIKQRRVRALPL